MRINIDGNRILHLLLLIFVSSVGAYVLIDQYEWSALHAFGLTVTIVVQISNSILSLLEQPRELETKKEKTKKKRK